MREAAFTVSYDGPALVDHSIDVRDLAPSLLALSTILDEANRHANGERATVRLTVHARKPGSFEIDLVLVQKMAQQLSGWLAGQEVTAAANLLALVTAGGGGLFGLIRWLRGRKPTSIEPKGPVVEIRVENETTIVNQTVLHLYQSADVRKAVEQFTSPLDREGVDAIRFHEDSNVIQELPRAERHSFLLPNPNDEHEEELANDVRRVVFTIISVVFRDSSKWKLHDGRSDVSVQIGDRGFLDQIDRGEQFGKGDMLVCDVRVRQWKRGATLHSSYEIVKVVEHRKLATQIPLTAISSDGDD